MAQVLDLKGTSLPSIQIEKAGVRVKNSAGTRAQVRNAGDTAYAELEASKVLVTGDQILINSDAISSGGDFNLTLARPTTGQTANWTLTFPTGPGSPNQVLQTDGSGNTTWANAGTTSECQRLDTTSLAYNSASTVMMFTLPANALVDKITVIVDTPFNTAATMSVGIAGNTSKYAGSNLIDLQNAAAKDRWIVTPGEIPVGTTESLIITFAAASATVGAARVLVEYSIPA